MIIQNRIGVETMQTSTKSNKCKLMYVFCMCTVDNSRALASGLSPVHTHTPDTNFFIAPVRIARYLV